jgi:multidrug efflux pump subunit AcrA (membrane-fusion protein)
MRERTPNPAAASQTSTAHRRRSRGLLWTAVAVTAAGSLFAIRRARGPETGRYHLERIDRGPIRREVTAAGTVSALTTVHDLSRVEVEANVGEADVGRVAVGEAVTLRCRAYPDSVLTGTVSEVHLAPRVTQGVAGYTVLIEADNRDHKVRPGMTASVSIEVARRDGVLRLPFRALGFTPPGMERTAPATPHGGCVFVLDHGRPRPVRVTVGLKDLRHAELVAGPLHEGDAVIVDREW